MLSQYEQPRKQIATLTLTSRIRILNSDRLSVFCHSNTKNCRERKVEFPADSYLSLSKNKKLKANRLR